MADLKAAGLPFGVSVTATKENLDAVLRDEFVSAYVEKGARLFIFVEYVPVAKGTEPLVLSAADKVRLQKFCDEQWRKHRAILFAFPGNEEEYGGCLAGGRGFVHINTGGEVEPCPFAPFSDVSVKDTGLADALSSRLLQTVRENRHLLKEGDGGCALWSNQELLKEIAMTTDKEAGDNK
jgi:MoaA/NifB/PqqE/SkfB family radical SAM enzyme